MRWVFVGIIIIMYIAFKIDTGSHISCKLFQTKEKEESRPDYSSFINSCKEDIVFHLEASSTSIESGQTTCITATIITWPTHRDYQNIKFAWDAMYEHQFRLGKKNAFGLPYFGNNKTLGIFIPTDDPSQVIWKAPSDTTNIYAIVCVAYDSENVWPMYSIDSNNYLYNLMSLISVGRAYPMFYLLPKVVMIEVLKISEQDRIEQINREWDPIIQRWEENARIEQSKLNQMRRRKASGIIKRTSPGANGYPNVYNQ